MNNADTTVSRWIAANPDALASSDLLSPNDTVGGYIVRRLLGKGLSGEVYEVWHPVLHAAFALKVYAPKSETDVARLLAEIQSLAKVRHPNIIVIHQFDEYRGHPFFVMDLAERLPERLPLAECRKLILGIASALGKLHDAGIIHRDIKPQNILFRDGIYLLADFSVVHVPTIHANADLENPTIQDNGRTLVGTHGFIAPEILEGGEPAPACDQFGLAATCLALCKEAAKNPRALRVLHRALNAKPELRYASIGDFAAAFQRASPRRPLCIIILSTLAAIGIISGFTFWKVRTNPTRTPLRDSFQGYDPASDRFLSPEQDAQWKQLLAYERELSEIKSKIAAKREEILGPYKGIDIFKIKDDAERLRVENEAADAHMKFTRETINLQNRQIDLQRKIEYMRIGLQIKPNPPATTSN